MVSERDNEELFFQGIYMVNDFLSTDIGQIHSIYEARDGREKICLTRKYGEIQK